MTVRPIRPLLPAGCTVAIVPIASPLPHPDSLLAARNYFERCGYAVRLCTEGLCPDRFLAGTDRQRAALLQQAFTDDSIGAVLAARGGYGTPRLLDLIDFDRLAAHPKPFISFSDGTALNLALLARAGWITYSGLNAFPDLAAGRPDPLQHETFWSVLRGAPRVIGNLECRQPGTAQGPLVGGCLSLLVTLLGTPWVPDFQGALLVLEDVGEEPYRIDRMLTQCRLAGVFEGLAGLILGSFDRCRAKNPQDGTVEQVLNGVSGWVRGPVVAGFPYGHRHPRCIFPVGEQAYLEAAPGGSRLAVAGRCPATPSYLGIACQGR